MQLACELLSYLLSGTIKGIVIKGDFMPILPSQTTQQEYDAILASYTGQDGQIDLAAWADDIQHNNEAHGNVEDLISAYVAETGTLPDFMMAPEAFIGSPDDYAFLEEDVVTQTLTELGQLYQNVQQPIEQMEALLADLRGQGEPGSPLDAARAFLDSHMPGADDSESTGEQLYDLFNTHDLRDIMSLFIGMGSPDIVLLLYTAFGKVPSTQEADEVILDKLQEIDDEEQDIIDEIADLDSADPESNTLMTELNQRRSTLSTIRNTLMEIMKKFEDSLDRTIQMASQFSDSESRLSESIIRNI